MAKAEPSLNYDNKPQESSPKPFKDFKKVATLPTYKRGQRTITIPAFYIEI